MKKLRFINDIKKVETRQGASLQILLILLILSKNRNYPVRLEEQNPVVLHLCVIQYR